MAARPHRHGTSDATSLRWLVQRLAHRLGLDSSDLPLYAEATCGRTWSSLGRADLCAVLDSLSEVAACRSELRRLRQLQKTRCGGGDD